MDRKALLERMAQTGEERLFFGRLLDRFEQCERHERPTHTDFLSPAEQERARDLLAAAAVHEGWALLGGYEGAERRMLWFLPDWLEEADEGEALRYLRASFREGESPNHRDFLGSLMALGFTREKLGDILVGERSADLIVSAELAPYLLEQWKSAGRTALRVREIERGELAVPEPKVREVRDTVATLRLDAVVAAGFSMSRAKAVELIHAGRVQRNHRDALKPDAPVAEGDVITARGLGKMELAEVGGLSKKGRTGIVIKRYL